jgi:putative colanic acid biosynthesis glycosyltransferase WcaI
VSARAAAVHVAFFNRSFYPDTTATGQLLTELCDVLAETHGWRVSVVAGAPLLPAAAPGRRARWGIVQRERRRGVSILRAQGTRWSKRRFVGRFTNYTSYFLSACYAGLRLERPDVVVGQTDPPIIGLAAYLAARRFGVPFVMAYKDVFPEVARLLEDFQSETVNRALQGVNCFLLRKADRVVALGETMRRMLIEGKGADPAKTLIIPDWADCSAIAPGPKRNPFSLAQGLADKFVVMHSGNVGLSQGLETLVEAAEHLSAFEDIAVVLVGEGVKKRALEDEVRTRGLRNVRFLPFQPQDGLRDSFATADVFVIGLKAGMAGYIVPSKLYGILAAGRPFVASVEDSSEVAGIAGTFDCGLVAKPGHARDLAEGILKLYFDRALAARMGASARRAGLLFDRARQVQAYHDLLLGLVSQGSGR